MVAEEGTEADKKFEPSLRWRVAVLSAVGGGFLAVDQVTKAIVRALVSVSADGTWTAPFLPGVLRLEFVANRGASFGMGQGHGALFVLLAVAVLVGIAWYLFHAPAVSRIECIGLAMVAGGAVGNAIDRVLLGYVTDFFATEFISFPVFNVADIGITCGVAVAFIGFLFLSPANKVDATVELNRRDAASRARRGRRGKGGR